MFRVMMELPKTGELYLVGTRYNMQAAGELADTVSLVTFIINVETGEIF